jgi:hypothetical protein
VLNDEPEPGDRRHDELGQELVVLSVQDEINQAPTGHGGSLYESPPQPRQHPLTLARVLLGYTDAELNGDEEWSCPIAGGRRTVALKPAQPPQRAG